MVFDFGIKGGFSMKKSIGILYIATGPYIVFWKDFFESFEQHFLLEYEKHYFIFTDSKDCAFSNNARVHIITIENQPWPLITLLRFSTFLRIEDMLKKLDYLVFSNANMICDEIITPEEFLPRDDKNECLSVTIHPGYYQKRKFVFPYERNKQSTAYVPWNCGENYVIGAMFCGVTKAFLSMSKTLKKNIEEDLKKNIIAKWHDESQLNRYILNKNGIRYLKPEYCYPFNMKVDYPRKISAVGKEDKFDVKSFKGQYIREHSKIRIMIGGIKRKLLLKEHCFYFFDYITRKEVREIQDAK